MRVSLGELSGWIQSLTFSPDARYLAAVYRSKAILISIETGNTQLIPGVFGHLKWATNDLLLMVDIGDEISFYSLESETVLGKVEPSFRIYSSDLPVSPDGNYFALRNAHSGIPIPSTLEIWSIKNRLPIANFSYYTGRLRSSDDVKGFTLGSSGLLATSLRDGQILLWEVKNENQGNPPVLTVRKPEFENGWLITTENHVVFEGKVKIFGVVGISSVTVNGEATKLSYTGDFSAKVQLKTGYN